MTGTVYTEDKLEYTFYPVKTFKVEIGVKAGNDAHVSLASEGSDAGSLIEIFLGGWGNSKSAIRLNKEKPDVAEVETPDLLSADEVKEFVLTWNSEGKVEIGLKGAEPFLSWVNPTPFSINHLGVRTAWGASGQWTFDGAKEVSTEDSMEYAFFPVHSGEVDFDVRAKNDAHLILSNGTAEAPMYEIILGGWDNSKSVIRKDGNDVAEASTENILNGTTFNKFWIKWNFAGVQVGRGGEEENFLNWNNSDPFPISQFGIRTSWGSDGYWHINGVDGEAEDPIETAVTEDNEVSVDGEGDEVNEVVKQIPPSMEGVNWVAASGGSVPEGSLVGGSDHGEVLHIARCEHEGAFIPGKLNPTHENAWYPWGGEENAADSYEVLVIGEDEVTWVGASGGEVPENAIPGGISLEAEPLYIGRTTHDDQMAVGKIHPSHGLLYISYGGMEISYPDYEVLCKN